MPNPMTAPLFLGMWLTMMVAMMFPTIAPMVLAHRLVSRHRGKGLLPSVTFVLGYLVIWTAIGVVPLAAFIAFRDLAADAPVTAWLPRLSGLVLLGALATLGRHREGLSHIAFTALTLLLVLVQSYLSTAA